MDNEVEDEEAIEDEGAIEDEEAIEAKDYIVSIQLIVPRKQKLTHALSFPRPPTNKVKSRLRQTTVPYHREY